MKKSFFAVLFSVIFIAACSLSSCAFFNWIGDDWLTKAQEEITDAAMERLCSAVAARDGEAVKAEFSADDIKDVEDFDGQVNKLLDYIAGEGLAFERVAVGSDGAGMGTYPREREFGGVRYDIVTSTERYKVVFDYRSHYSEGVGHLATEKIGFVSFDIISVKNDRECADRYYTGCPFGYKGINFDYKTTYIFCPEEYDYKIALCEGADAFEPVIINNKEELDVFCNGREFDSELISAYTEEFFVGHSLFVAGTDGGGVKYKYVPQFLYMGDFVMVRVVGFPYGMTNDENESDYTENGAIFFVELPEKIPATTPTILDLSHFGE